MPFKCVQCDFASDNKHALNSHVRIHDADARRSNNSDVAPLAATIVNNYDEEDNTPPVTQTSDTTSHHNRNHDSQLRDVADGYIDDETAPEPDRLLTPEDAQNELLSSIMSKIQEEAPSDKFFKRFRLTH